MSNVLRMTPEAFAQHQARAKGQTREELDALVAGKKNKYGNTKVMLDGMRFDSKREADRYLELKLLRDAGEITGLRIQPHLPCDVNGMHVCTYIADFAYTKRNDSRETFEDAKGHRTALYILKKKLVKACHGIDVEEV